jgi:hypothetical protein
MAKLPVTNPPSGAEPTETKSNSSQAAICRHVLGVLGRPVDFLRITVRQVTSEGHRVNVVVGPDMATARIAHSYFITTDELGNVQKSTPLITKHY